jgi:hypothetical protein
MVACELSELRTERRTLYFVKQAMCNLSCGRNDEVFWYVTDRRTWICFYLKVLASDSPETSHIYKNVMRMGSCNRMWPASENARCALM